MAITTYEGIVKNGEIRLKAGVKLPENARVYVVISDTKMSKKKVVQILSPHFVQREDAERFKLTVTKIKPD